MAVIYIDRKAYDVKPGKNLLETCLSLGFDLPYFCWHPAMGSVGACRQCAVKLFKDEQDTRGRLVMSCMEAVKDNLYLSIEDPAASAFRAQNIEWLMTNHPHDCAVCDEGGSCHLQDMTVMTGHNYRRFRYKKRSYHNQYLGPFINHEMNRCIQCYRCVRFYKDYAGGNDLDVFAAHSHIYFGREKDGILENEFSGNLAEVCPTGVFTDKTLKEHYTRKWDLTMAPSICQHCSLGCNIIAGERYGELRQITNRFNGEINGYFICDRGRFGYEFTNSVNRIRQALIRGEVPEATDQQGLYNYLQEILSADTHLLGIGSPRASLESNFALRQLVGPENFYQGISEPEAILMEYIVRTLSSGHVHVPSLKETEEADAILVLGEDLTNSAPRLALALRQAVRKTALVNAPAVGIPSWHDAAQRELVQQEKGNLFIAYPTKTKLDDIATNTLYTPPDNIARFGFAVAHYLNKEVLLPANMDADTLNLARSIAQNLQKARRPLIISGTGNYNVSILKAATSIAFALSSPDKKADLCFVVPECNSMGLAMMQAPSLNHAVKAIQGNNNCTVILLENDLYRRSDKETIDSLFNSAKQVIVLDHLHNESTNRANVLIPAATFAEADGTVVNNEGRAQHFFRVFQPANENIRESWRWLDEFSHLKNGKPLFTFSLEELLAQLTTGMPQFRGAEESAPPARFRLAGQKIPREPHRYSGRTAMLANINVSEPKPPQDNDTALSFTMEGYRGIPPAPFHPFFWSPGWNSAQSVNKYQREVGGELLGGDPGIRLFPESARSEKAFLNTPDYMLRPAEPSPAEWLFLPLYHIFGSEELSIYTPGIAERTPKPYIAIGKADAEKLGIRPHETLRIQIGATQYKLPAIIKEELTGGLAGIPFNIPGLTGIGWPAIGTLKKGLI